MAKHYALRGTSYTDVASDLAAALLDYYGAGVTIHYNLSGYVIFSCPAISDKVIKFYGSGLAWDYGTAYVSGSTISNPISFATQGSFANADLVLGDKFLLFTGWQAGSYTQVVLIGKMQRGDHVAMGWSNYSSGSYAKQFNTTTGVANKSVGWTSGFRDADSKMYKTPLIIADTNGYSTIAGVYTISYPKTASTIIGLGYLITPTHLQTYLYSQIGYELQTPIMVEFESSVWYR
jgi:hypothetical protein